MRFIPPRDWSQCPECEVPMDYVEAADDLDHTGTARVTAAPCGHTFEVPVG